MRIGSLISDSLFPVEAALEGIGLAYTFEKLSLPSDSFPGS